MLADEPKKPHGLWKASWGGAHHGLLSGTVLDQTPTSQRSSSQAANVVGRRQHHVWTRFRDEDLFVRLTNSGQALVRVSGWAWSWSRLGHCPTCRTQLFRIVLLRRLNLPLTLSARFCRCGLPLDLRGHPPWLRAQGLGSWEGGGARWRL